MEISQGIVSALEIPEQKGTAACKVGTQTVILHRDLQDRVKEGDDVVVAGIKGDDNLAALAVNNKTAKKISYIDGSNLVLAIGGCGFITFLCFVFSVQYLGVGNNTLGMLNAVLSLAGVIGVFSFSTRLIAIKKASTHVS